MYAIAIDGPAGAGKSSVAKAAAKALGFVYVDTGALYRTVGLYLLRSEVDPADAEAVEPKLRDIQVDLKYEDGVQHVILNGEDVSGLIRSEEVGRMASATSVYGPVRQKLVQLQKQLAREADVIMDGRDIGTCVLPDAPAKIYLTASVETRARRRFRELEERGEVCDIREIEKDIEERDYRDMHRENSPLRQAEDAVLLDSSHMTIEQVVDSIIRIARERGYEG